MAVDLELRYRGLRSPHKLKAGVSGCARECAEARGKDVGVIATEKGWNLYVDGAVEQPEQGDLDTADEGSRAPLREQAPDLTHGRPRHRRTSSRGPATRTVVRAVSTRSTSPRSALARSAAVAGRR